VKPCDAVQELLAAHELEALGATEQALVDHHLGECDPCQVAQDETAACLALIEAPPVAAPPAVWGKIRARIEREGAADPVRDGAPSPVIALSCSFCRGGMTRGDSVYCASCLAPHHPECFREHGRCTVMGCGEESVVRPADLPPLRIDTRRRPRRGPRRQRWLLGGLASLVAAGAGVAALTDEPEAATPPTWELRSDLSIPYRVDIREATLGEVCDELERLSDAPKIRLPSECRDLLVRRLTTDGLHWSEALAVVVEHDLGLTLSQDGEEWLITAPSERSVSALPKAYGGQAPVDATHLLDLGSGERQPVYRGWGQRVLASPGDARLIAIEEEGRLSVFEGARLRGVEALPFLFQDMEWSPEGARLAYVGGQDGRGQLGLFDVGSRSLNHFLVREFPGVDDASRLAWVSPERLLLKTEDDLKIVSTLVGGQALTLSRPSPEGYRRFDLLALEPSPAGDARFLVLYPDGVETWSLEGLAPKQVTSRVQLPAGYEVVPTLARGRVVVLLAATALLLDPETGHYEVLAQRASEEDPFRVAVDPSGAHVAWLQLNEGRSTPDLFVRPLASGGRYYRSPAGDARVRGFRWSPGGARLAWWTDETLHTFDVASPRDRSEQVAAQEDWRVRDVQWAGADALVVTARGLDPREAQVRVERED
jgi:hypothetical protein